MELREHAPPSRPGNTGMPYREDCWSEGETSALVDAWGERYVELNRGNLRQKQWQEVADAVNSRIGNLRQKQWQEVADAVNSRIGITRRKIRTDVQCKNRIDTLKKKYKLEKARLVEGTSVTSSWPFYSRLDVLIGATTPAAGSGSSGGGGGMKRPPHSASYSHSPSPPLAIPLPYHKKGSGMLPTASPLHGKLPLPALPTALPVDDSFIRKAAAAAAAAASSLPMANAFIRKTPPASPPVPSGEHSFIRKTPASQAQAQAQALPMDNSFIRKAAAAAAAAKDEAAEEEEEDESEAEGEGNSEPPRSVSMSERKRGKKRGREEGILELAKAIEKMGEMYERVEGARQRQMMDMEKKRMEFLKVLELQRMEMFADLKVQMEKLKRIRRSSDAGELIGSVAALSFLSDSSFL